MRMACYWYGSRRGAPLYQFSRSMYRRLAPLVAGPQDADVVHHRAQLLRELELGMGRLGSDPFYFARPTRSIFREIRPLFPMSHHRVVYAVVRSHVELAARYVEDQSRAGRTFDGSPIRCNSTTRKGTQCVRTPVPGTKYCPSHQHLAEPSENVLTAA